MRFLQTLTARVIIGSLILAGTAAGLSIWTTANQERLNREIRIIRTGYLVLALRTRDLNEKQSALVDYLRDELVGESNVRRVEARVRRSRQLRDKLLAEIDAAIAAQRNPHKVHVERLNQSRDSVAGIRELVEKTSEFYDEMLSSPPIERLAPAPLPAPDAVGPLEPEPPAADPERALAEAALKSLIEIEARVAGRSSALARYQRSSVETIARGLERGSVQLRNYSIICLVAAIAVGLAVIVFTGLTLGPLRRLPSAAQRIAEGDYAARIPLRGPTEVAELAREFNQMASAIEGRERELVRSERLATVGKMAAMITHEVRNPLSAIGLHTELLEEELGALGDGATEARVLCTAIISEIDRLTAITETYLQFARLPEPRLHPEDLGELIRGTISLVGEEMRGRGITLEVDIADALPAVDIDHAQIKQGLLNLLRNAAEALDAVKDARVEVAARRRDEALEVVVRDNGPGIPADVQRRLFEPFFTTKSSGTGLGLALTQQIVREHGGTLEVDSKLGAGARFTIRLPITATPTLLLD